MSTIALSSKPKSRVGYLINYEGPRDVVAFCPGCKSMETISLVGKAIAPTSRFTQRGDAVFHACGSDVPCRLYSLS
jgi:hypothetical protein